MDDRWEDWFQPGERLLWEGAPAKGRIHWGRNIFVTCFGIPFLLGGLAVAGTGIGVIPWNESAAGVGMTIFALAFSVPFITVGAGMVFGTWVADYLQPRRTRYALTDRAGYVATNFWKRGMDVIPVKSGVRIEYQETRRGAGTVYFHFDHHTDSDGDKAVTKRGFENIPDAKHVYGLIRDLKAGLDPEVSR